jgi:type I restriction enzyme, S subunit
MTEFKEANDLPNGWVNTTIEALSNSIQYGYTASACNDKVGPKFLRITDIQDNVVEWENVPYCKINEENDKDKYLLHSGDIVFARTGATVGKSYLIRDNVPSDTIFASYLIRINLDRFIIPKFVYNFFQSNFYWEQIKKSSSGIGQPNVNGKKLGKIILALPPLNEQHRIVARIEELFSHLDAGVQALLKAKAQLQRYRQAVLKAAVEGKLTEDWRKAHPEVEPAEKLLERIRDKEDNTRTHKNKNDKNNKCLVNDQFDSLTKLPETWAWAKWELVGISQNGRLFPSKEYQPNGFKLLRPGNLHSSGKVIWTKENTRYLPESWSKDFPSFIVGPRELVMNLTAQSLRDEFLGRICITGPSERCLLNQRIARLTPMEILPEYLFWMFKSQLFRRFVNSLNTGSLIQHMFTSQLDDFFLPLPPLEEQSLIAAEIERLFSVADNIEDTLTKNSQLTERLRQSVLKRAFEGKLIPQDPNDEPASMLLEQIKAERANDSLRKSGRINRNNTHQMRLTQ